MAGIKVGKGGSKQWANEHNSQGVDAGTQDYLQRIWNAAQQAGQTGPSPLVTSATDFNGMAQRYGGNGLAALSGDQGAASQFMNPYQQQVINAAQQQFKVNNQNALNAVNDQATQAGAFGGSRQGVAQGVAMAQMARDQNSQMSGLLQSGYNDAMQRAAQTAGYGFQGAGNNAALGMQGVGNPYQWMMQMLRGGFVMPTGSYSNGQQTQTQVGGQAGFKLGL